MFEMHCDCLNNKCCPIFLKCLYGLFVFLVSQIFRMSFLDTSVCRCHEGSICDRVFLEPKVSQSMTQHVSTILIQTPFL